MSTSISVRKPGRAGLALLFHPRWGFRSWAWFTATCAAVAGAVFAGVAVGQWRDFQANAYDLGMFDQIIWNTSHGRWFESSFLTYDQYLGQHFSPVLALFVPFYWLGAGPVFLTVAQAFVAAIAAVPLFFAARRFTRSEPLAACLAVAYLLNPYLHRAVAFDFHPETMVALPAFASAWAAGERRFPLAAVLAAAVLPFKEDSVFLVFALAALIAWAGGRKEAAVLGVFAIAWLVLVAFWAMPHYRAGYPPDLVPRYEYLAPGATSLGDLVTGILEHPHRLISTLADRDVMWTIALFVLVSAPLMLVRPLWLLALVPGLALAVLSIHPPQHALELHYAVQLVPIALIGATLGVRALDGRFPRGVVALAVIAPAAVGFTTMSPLSPGNSRGPSPSEAHLVALDQAIATIPQDESVSAQSSIVPRLSQRETIAEFPWAGLDEQWVIVDRFGPRSTQSTDAGFWSTLDSVRERYDRVFERDGVEVFRRPS